MRRLIAFLIFFLCVACGSNTTEVLPELYPVRELAAMYCQIDHDFYENSDNLIVFVAESSWGSGQNYLLTLKKNDTSVSAVYHEIDPLDEFYNLKRTNGGKRNLFFNGFAFQVDMENWIKITTRLDSLINATSSKDFKIGIMDGSSFAVRFEGKTTVVNNGLMREKFRLFSSYILKTYIDPIEKLKVPPGVKVTP